MWDDDFVKIMNTLRRVNIFVKSYSLSSHTWCNFQFFSSTDFVFETSTTMLSNQNFQFNIFLSNICKINTHMGLIWLFLMLNHVLFLLVNLPTLARTNSSFHVTKLWLKNLEFTFAKIPSDFIEFLIYFIIIIIISNLTTFWFCFKILI